MSVQTTVEIGVFLTTGDAPYFRVGNAIKGRLNNTEYRIAGPIFYDITENVTNVSVKRGKNRELERYSAGQATVVLNNETRLFDPLNEDSIFFGNIIPRRQIRIRSGGINQFVGVVEDWNLDYDVSGKSNASIVAADGFSLFAQQTLTPGTATPQTTGERVEAVLSQPTVAWPLTDRVIDTGSSTLGADVFDGNVLSYLQQVEASEQGQFFINKDGRVRFINGAVTPTTQGSWVLSATNLVTNPSMEAASGTVTVRTNLVTNPSFETGTTGWFGTGTLTRITTDSYSGSACIQTVTNTVAQQAANSILNSVSTLGAYTLSLWVKGESGKSLSVDFRELQSDGTTVVDTVSSPTITATGSWQRVSVSNTLTATNAKPQIIVRNQTSGSHTILIDAVQLEVGSTASPYFDGSIPAAGDFTYAWSGTAHASTSLQRGVGVSGQLYGATNNAQISSSEWSSTGTKSLKLIPISLSNSTSARFSFNTTNGVTYTAKAKIRLSSGQTGTLNSLARRIRVTNATDSALLAESSQAPNVVGVHELSVTFTATGSTSNVQLWNGASAGNGDVWWDDLIVVEGNYTGNYFDGSTPTTFTKRYGWNGTANASTSYEETADVIAYPAFSDAGDGIPYTGATVSYGTELLFNQAQVTSPAGTATANNVESQEKYGITQTSVDTLLSNFLQTENLALFWVAKYGEPEYRFQALDIDVDGLDGDDLTKVLGLELGDIIQIKFTPNGIGAPIERYSQISSISHNITAGRHTIQLGVGSLQYSFLVLDDVGFGLLDVNALAF